MKFKYIFFLPAVILALIFLKIRTLHDRRIGLPAIISLLGFVGMSTQMIIIYTFQSLYGYVYHTIGILTTLFMAGLALGSYYIYRKSAEIQDPQLAIKAAIGSIIAVLIILTLSITSFPLALASLLIALPIGAAFPLAVKIQEKYQSEVSSLAGVLYGSDLLGGSLAALLTTIFLIPLFGILNTLWLIITLGVAALVISYS
jgi:spermidine synthase